MSAQHTPGPWSATEASGHVVDAGGAPVAVTAGLANGPWATEYRANARLIAAAPDLLEALIAITNQLERIGDTREHKDGAFIRDARAAIAKATGSAE